ncbi:hypothetical protein F511_30137 [Dorcoceras hygrometricum]|uniref:Uncharacterized protein n=1 Tax=Dorcoceras hygrometricum TaxID=472368 RepID=A0A2Z7BUI2_9LAMI|nr:hypothetical protein F511_30137 [Dorcoceras hygrometricum]
MQHAIINAMKCIRAIKDRIARPVNQLAIISIEPLYHAQQVSRWKSSVRDLQDPSAHHSSVVFRRDKSLGHHSDDSVGLFRHDKPTDFIARITAMFTLQAIKICSIRTSILKILPHRFLKCTTGLPGSYWVEIERATHNESSATKITQIIGGERINGIYVTVNSS